MLRVELAGEIQHCKEGAGLGAVELPLLISLKLQTFARSEAGIESEHHLEVNVPVTRPSCSRISSVTPKKLNYLLKIILYSLYHLEVEHRRNPFFII